LLRSYDIASLLDAQAGSGLPEPDLAEELRIAFGASTERTQSQCRKQVGLGLTSAGHELNLSPTADRAV
jgi:hypothetical protein